MNKKRSRLSSELKHLESVSGKIGGTVVRVRDSAFARFPFLFIFLTPFGLVATFYGLEKLIDSIPYFVENPHMVLITGILVLFGTGTLYKKLS
jgi:hypothetical protein